MKILFPQDIATAVSTKTDREQLRRAEVLLRHAGIVPGNEGLTTAAQSIREFVDAQERQNEAEVEQLSQMDPPATTA